MIKIDIDTRCWQIPKEEAFLGVESDDKVKILQFELSKNEFCDGLNFTDCNCFINYKNEGNDTIPYLITDMEVKEDGTVTFTWEVSRGATIFKGNTFAVLCAKKVRNDGTITNEWNSRIGSFTVAKGIEPLSSIAEVPEIDIISQLLLVAQQTNANAQTNINQSNLLLEKAEGLGYLKEDFDVLESRMNQFTSLKEGSTTGDAELQDIRVGADGKTYDTAGEAVRGQVSELKGDIANSKKAIAELADKKITKFYANSLGETTLNDSDKGKIHDMMLYGKSLQDGTPTPTNPIEIQTVVNPKLSVSGKNLLNFTLETTTLNGVTCINNGDGTYTLNGTASNDCNFTIYNKDVANENIGLKKGVTYRVIGCPSGGSTETYFIMFNFWDVPAYDTGNGVNKQFDSSKTGVRLDIVIKSGTVCNNLVFKPMITTDLTATYDDFEPYKGEQSATLPYTLNAIPVSSGGNVTIDGQQYIADYLDIEKKQLVRMTSDVDLGTCTWIYYAEYKMWATDSFVNNAKSKTALLCECVKYNLVFLEDVSSIGTFVNGTSNVWFRTGDNVNSPTGKAIYQLATPIITDLTDEEVQEFIELATYYPTTNVIVTSDQLDGYVKFNYPLSMANGWNLIKEQLGDTREYIYDMELQSAEAYVNSEYAVTLTELGV